MKSPESKSSSAASPKKETAGMSFFPKDTEAALASEKENVQTFFKRSDSGSPFFTPVQPKLKVHPPDDVYEKEADAAAGRVVQDLHHSPAMQRQEPTGTGPGIQPKPLVENVTPIQTRRAFESPSPLELNVDSSENETPIQNKTADSPGADAPPLESQLQSSKGQGTALPAKTRSGMESGFGADFSGVRTHTGSNAVQMSQQLGARAFTHGNDIYFNQGEYQPGTEEGDQLLAHELTHTIQQGAAASNPSIQRAGGIDNVKAKTFDHLQKGQIDTDAKTISIPTLKIPDFKVAETSAPLKLRSGERSTRQAEIWDAHIRDNFNPESKLKSKLQAGGAPSLSNPTGQPIYVLKLKGTSGNQANYVIGDQATIIQRIGRPYWDRQGTRTFYQVDHKQEYQLSGEDVIGNMWLLQDRANMSSGSKIRNEKNEKVDDLLEAASRPGEKQVWERKPNLETIKNRYEITFRNVRGGLNIEGNPEKRYTKEDILGGKSLDGLDVLTSAEINRLGLLRDDVLNLFTSKSGGGLYKIENWDAVAGDKTIHLGLGVNIDINRIQYNERSGTGKLYGSLFRRANRVKKYLKEYEYSFDILPIQGIPHTGYIERSSVLRELNAELEAVGLSPVNVQDASIEPEKGIVARGKIMPSVPVLENAGIDLVLSGDDIYLEKVFSTGDFKVPAPFKISDSSLAIRAGTQGIEFEGQVDFGIDRVGTGSISAFINSRKEFGVRGHFEFDKKLFDNARVEVAYENGQWSVSGAIEIPRGKIKGIKKATATIAYTEGTLAASGQVEPDIKGIKEGSFELRYSQEQFMMSGRLQLSPEIPRLKNGEINVSVESTPEGNYKVKGSGVAAFDFPGIDTGLNIQYDDGALLIEATVNFEKGIAKGEVKVGATNRPVDNQGNPQGEPGERWVIYGNGTLTVKITPWLQATAGVRFLPNGEMEILGRIELPSNVEVFPRKEINKNLFAIPTIEIPLFAIPLGPRSLGLVAQINGGLDFVAGFGPGQIQDLFGQINYNPARPEETTLSGGGRFVIPADASLKLHADLSLGLSVGIASLTGGIEVAGSVGLQGEAAASINLSWNPTSGLELNAEGSVKVSPRFKFDVNLIARATLDLFLFELSKEWRYNLASVEWGPGIEFGITFPIHYKEGEPFNISADDIQIIKPDLDIPSMLKGIAGKVRDAF